MNKETFILRSEWYGAISKLSVKEKAKMLDNLFGYHIKGSDAVDNNTAGLELLWSMLEPNLVRNIENYDRRKDTSSENGKKGGRPSINKNLNNLEKPSDNLNNLTLSGDNLTEPNESLSVYVSVPVPESVPAPATEPVYGSVPDTDWEKEKQNFLNDEKWEYKFVTEKQVSREDYRLYANNFISTLDLQEDFKNRKELKKHFTNWFDLKVRKGEIIIKKAVVKKEHQGW